MELKQIIDTEVAAVWVAENMLCSVAYPGDCTVVTISNPAKDIEAIWRCPMNAEDEFTWLCEGGQNYASCMKELLDEECLLHSEDLVLREFARAAIDAFGHLAQLPNNVTSDLESVKLPAVDLAYAIGELCDTVLTWDDPDAVYAALATAGFSKEKVTQIRLEHNRLLEAAERLKKLYAAGKE